MRPTSALSHKAASAVTAVPKHRARQDVGGPVAVGDHPATRQHAGGGEGRSADPAVVGGAGDGGGGGEGRAGMAGGERAGALGAPFASIAAIAGTRAAKLALDGFRHQRRRDDAG